MADVETPIDTLQDRLTGLLADWGAEFSMVLRELETKRARVRELEANTSGRDEELEDLRRQVESQEELIRTLRTDAEEASRLRREVNGKDLELERLASELESKAELIGALRKDAEAVARLKDDAQTKDSDIAKLRAEKENADRRAVELDEELTDLRECSADQSAQESTELETVRAELEARKTLIDSLRADANRLVSLEANLDEKRNVVAKLENSMNRQAGTITELKQSVSNWQNKYARLKASQRSASAASTSAALPTLSDTDLLAIESIETGDHDERTIAIDMRESLLEARRTSTGKK